MCVGGWPSIEFVPRYKAKKISEVNEVLEKLRIFSVRSNKVSIKHSATFYSPGLNTGSPSGQSKYQQKITNQAKHRETHMFVYWHVQLSVLCFCSCPLRTSEPLQESPCVRVYTGQTLLNIVLQPCCDHSWSTRGCFQLDLERSIMLGWQGIEGNLTTQGDTRRSFTCSTEQSKLGFI